MAGDNLDLDSSMAIMLPTSAEPPNGQYEVDLEYQFGRHLLCRYGNGYGASVVIGQYSYGGPEGLYELAVLHGREGAELGELGLCYHTPITSDVIGYLTAEQVVVTLHRIAKLPRNDSCEHRDPWPEDIFVGVDLAGGSDRTVTIENGPEEGK
jgi:hypothetical protein